MRFFVLALLVVLASASTADAHGIRSAYLGVTAQDATHAIVTLNSPAPASGIEFVAPPHCTLTDATALECPNGLRGSEIEVRGMGPIISETSVVVELEGQTMAHLLTASSPRWTIPFAESNWSVARQYVALGIEHILGGADHLLFLLGLVLVVRKVRAVLLAETAFTISHTISFSATALGLVRIPSAPAEACIALSLVLVALDIGRRRHRQFAGMAFAFGLVHGLGFAGALREVGLPDKAILPALAGFAGGIELGQIAFLAAVMLLVHFVSKTRARRALDLGAAYAIGAVGCFWLFQRLH